MKILGNEIKPGMIIEHKNDLWSVLKTQHVKPGKGGAFNQVELKSIRKETKLNERFRSSDTVERAILDDKKFKGKTNDLKDFFIKCGVSYVNQNDIINHEIETLNLKDHSEKELDDFLNSLTRDQFQKIQDFFDGLPKLKKDVKWNCSGCQKEREVTLEGMNAFFG